MLFDKNGELSLEAGIGHGVKQRLKGHPVKAKGGQAGREILRIPPIVGIRAYLNPDSVDVVENGLRLLRIFPELIEVKAAS
jgi:hypothetical protein